MYSRRRAISASISASLSNSSLLGDLGGEANSFGKTADYLGGEAATSRLVFFNLSGDSCSISRGRSALSEFFFGEGKVLDFEAHDFSLVNSTFITSIVLC